MATERATSTPTRRRSASVEPLVRHGRSILRIQADAQDGGAWQGITTDEWTKRILHGMPAPRAVVAPPGAIIVVPT